MAQKCSKCGSEVKSHCSRGCSSCTSGYVCPRHGKDWAYRTGGGFFSSGVTGRGSKCRKCGARTVNCASCRGNAGRTCSSCGGTGQSCPSHGRFWS